MCLKHPQYKTKNNPILYAVLTGDGFPIVYAVLTGSSSPIVYAVLTGSSSSSMYRQKTVLLSTDEATGHISRLLLSTLYRTFAIH